MVSLALTPTKCQLRTRVSLVTAELFIFLSASSLHSISRRPLEGENFLRSQGDCLFLPSRHSAFFFPDKKNLSFPFFSFNSSTCLAGNLPDKVKTEVTNHIQVTSLSLLLLLASPMLGSLENISDSESELNGCFMLCVWCQGAEQRLMQNCTEQELSIEKKRTQL